MGGDGSVLEWMRVIGGSGWWEWMVGVDGGSGWEWEYNRWDGMVVGGTPV